MTFKELIIKINRMYDSKLADMQVTVDGSSDVTITVSENTLKIGGEEKQWNT